MKRDHITQITEVNVILNALRYDLEICERRTLDVLESGSRLHFLIRPFVRK